MTVISTRSGMVARLLEARLGGRRVALVPTLGALHRGHGTLIARAADECDLVVVSVFVNPLQFDDPSDFDRYPRDLDRDVAFAQEAGADVVFAPGVPEFLGDPPGAITVDPGPLAEVLEGAARPGHFVGVATIVAKLFALVWPDVGYFGEKDFQQLAIVRALVSGLSFPTTVVGCPTVREPDGLALSSRNARLSPTARSAAPTLYAALVEGRQTLRSGSGPSAAAAAMARVVRAEPQIALEYAVCVDEQTLVAPRDDRSTLRLLIAASIDGVRLIDNLSGADDGVE
jgi:pantoate--beta-alanine ligase